MSASADIDKLIARVALKDRADVEDVLQEVCVKIWNKADRFSTGRASAIAWLAPIARNQAIARYRSRRPASDKSGEMPDPADDAPSPENAMLAKDETTG